MRHVPLEDALRLVCLYAEKESPKYEKAALKFLRRYLDEKSPTLKNFAKSFASSRSGSSLNTRTYRLRARRILRLTAQRATFQASIRNIQ
jgi:hypothetical protein